MKTYYRHAGGRISVRELGDAAGLRMSVSPPAGGELIDADTAERELAALALERAAARRSSTDTAAAARLGAYRELLDLGLSPAAAALISGWSPTPAGRPADSDPGAGGSR